MEFFPMFFYYGSECIIAVVIGSLIGMGYLAFLGRIVYNGVWQLPQATKYTWTTRAGHGTTFVSSRMVLMPGELSSRQINMKEPTYRWATAILLLVFMTTCLYVIAVAS